MNREFKFRAFDPKLKVMSKPFSFGGIINFGDVVFKSLDLKNHIVMQFYMNLKMYNQEDQSFDAYEGDIIEVGRYTPTEYYTVVIEDIRKTPDNLFGSSVVSRKLLGNIHENTELLNLR